MSAEARSRRRWLVAATLVAAVAAFGAAANLVERLTRAPGGPRSSSYATAPHGLAAYAALLGDEGHSVRRVRERAADAELDPAATLVVLDPGPLGKRDSRALRRFVEDGGRLVAGGRRPGRWLGTLLDGAPTWSARGPRAATPLVPVAELAGVRSVRAAGEGSWADAGPALPALGGDGRTLLAVARVGRGRIALLADPSPLQNRLLDRADNAELGLALAGERRRPVRFLESVHGFDPVRGLAAIPWSWRFALGGLVAAALVLMVARGRRLGPPELEGRELPPPRRRYVESLAAVLARTKQPGEAAAPVRDEARLRLAHRAGVGADADEEALRRAGRAAGLAEDELGAVLGSAPGEAGALAAGRALARLVRSGGSLS